VIVEPATGAAEVAGSVEQVGEPGASRLLLWDVDGTLLRAGDIAALVFTRAIERVLGHPPEGRVQMSGKTDPQIAREYLELSSVPDPGRHVAAIVREAETELRERRQLIAERGRVLPGVSELLPALHADPHFLQSVLTGNTASNARVKLGTFGLDRWLDLEVAAYGSDDDDRCRLVPIALERAARLRGVTFAPEQAWVIGDSANDLACARAAGARCLLVATGRSGVEELTAMGADACFADLSDVPAVMRLLAS